MSSIDIVAINEAGHVVAMATSDDGPNDRAFARDYSRKFRIEKMPVEEAVELHLKHLETLPGFQAALKLDNPS